MSSEAREPVKLIAEILKAELGLDAAHILLTNQMYDLPKDSDLFVALGYVDHGTLISRSSVAVPTVGGMSEVQSATFRYVVQVDLLSYGPEARLRAPEFALALSGILAQQLQTKWGMQIARHIGPLVDASSLEETKRLNRFTTTVIVTAGVQKTKTGAPYYDTFEADFKTDHPESQDFTEVDLTQDPEVSNA